MSFTILYPAQGLKDLLEDNGLNQLPKSRPNMWVTYFVVLLKLSRPVGWVQLKFGYFSGKARGIKAHYEEVKQIQEEQDALAMGGPEMDHELSMVKNSRIPTAIVTSFPDVFESGKSEPRDRHVRLSNWFLHTKCTIDAWYSRFDSPASPVKDSDYQVTMSVKNNISCYV